MALRAGNVQKMDFPVFFYMYREVIRNWRIMNLYGAKRMTFWMR